MKTSPCTGCGKSAYGKLCQPCRRARWTRSCENCGELFTSKNLRQRFCRLACHRAESRRRTCEVCGNGYIYTYSKQRTCSRECGAELRRQVYGFAGKGPATSRESLAKIACLVYHRNCPHCGKLFVARNANRRACTPECAYEIIKRQAGDRIKTLYRTDPVWRADFQKASRARKGKTISYLMVRDRGRCGICRKPVRARAGLRGPSVDHIVPRTRWPHGKPGVDDPANLQLAHLDCNIRKSNRGHGEQLLLIG